jgi:hypothetical protein
MRYHLLTALACLLTTSFAACGGGGDDATKFAGSWSFTSGSTVNATCVAPGPAMVAPFDLTGLGVTITKVDGSHIKADVMLQADQPACTVTFQVSGSTATADANQTCMVSLNLTGTATAYPIQIKSWTITASAGTLTTQFAGGVFICTATGNGTLVPGSVDAGSSGGDA